MLNKKTFIFILLLQTFSFVQSKSCPNETYIEFCIENNGCGGKILSNAINFVGTLMNRIVDRVTNVNTTSKPDVEISRLISQSADEQSDGPYADELSMSNVLFEFNEMSLIFFKIVLENEPRNFVFSPFGVSQLIAMLVFGAHGTTRLELQNFVKMLNLKDYISPDTFNNMPEFESNDLKIKNNIYIDKKFYLKRTFRKIIQENFDSPVEQLDFKNSIKARKTINREIKNSGISNTLKPGDVANNDNLFLLNIIHLEAGWELGHQKKKISRKPFYINNYGRPEQVPTMEHELNILYKNHRLLDAKIVKIFHRISEQQIAMYIIIPNDIEGLKGVEENIDKLNLQNFDHESTWVSANLFLPKFKLQSNIDLKNYLKKIGINQAFTTDADFGGISQMKNLFINKIVQKSTIEVEEKNNFNTRFYDLERNKIDIKVNRPFIVVITNEKFIIFTGRVSNPLL